MNPRVAVRPLGMLGKIADGLMVPIMYLASGSLCDAPQRTHRWNNLKLSHGDIEGFLPILMVHCFGSQDQNRLRNSLPFHIPVLGGWRDYRVIEPVTHQLKWYVGWVSGKLVGLSRVPVEGPVRVLVGPGDVAFFGVRSCDGEQISIRKIAKGRIGHRGPYSDFPLF